MNRISVVVMIFLAIFLAGCSTETSQTNPGKDLEREREILEQRAQEYLEEQRNTSEPRKEEPEQPRKDEVFTEQPVDEKVYQEDTSDDTSADDPTEEMNSVAADIAIRDVDVDFTSSFELDDDKVTFEVEFSSEDLDEGTSFVGEVVILEDFRETCQFIAQVGADDIPECSIDGFPNYGEYEYEVFLDIREQFNESDYGNNYYRDEFELEE